MRAILVTAIIIVVFVAGVVSRLPLSLVTDRLEPYAEFGTVRGTIWKGEVRDVAVAGQPVGNASFDITLLPLLAGRVETDLGIDGGGVEGAGTLGFDGKVIIVRDAAGRADLGRFDLADAFGQPLLGDVDATIRNLVFSLEEGCRDADLSVRTDAISRSLGVYAGRGFEMAGEGYCDGESLVVPLEGAGDEAAVRAEFRINQRGEYLTRVAIEPKNPDLERFVAGMGLAREGSAYVIERGGRVEETR